MRSQYTRALMSLLSFGIMIGDNAGVRAEKPKESKEEKAKRLELKQIERNYKKGLKPFYFGNEIVWARDKKNADRKAKNLNLI